MNGTTGVAETAAELHHLRQRVRADRQTIGLPLSVFGALTLANAALVAAHAATSQTAVAKLALLLYWPCAGAIGLLVLGWHAGRVAQRAGVGGGRRSYRPVTIGYVASLPVLAVLFVPVFFVGGYWATLEWPAAILTAISVRQRNNTLYGAAVGTALAGLAQGLFAATPHGSSGAWAAIGVEVALGVALTLAGLMASRRGRAVR
ncbi:hypothetical protein [Actinoplanes teichomyceticus]|uniref:Uncharacterized protein n=1 Tax=Actinoplanes teichomyceticus TaxID=1867 RepID=A0A561VIS8_ACTTI|nr:hypothetical protein [Actinoplanes teichomyceticus]TWG11497.1 hypothetical protein FHX34_106227 [Actinoplanes teichomyceticus]GIF15689.1 hypothetical protein Ate01nite_57210 [Actinoplanes teichomyceticus]